MYCSQCGSLNGETARFCTQCGRALEGGAGSTQPGAIGAPPIFAGFWMRVGAYLIDGFIVGAGNMVLIMVLGFSFLGMAIGSAGQPQVSEPMFAAVTVFWLIATVIAPWLYHSLFESSARQATPGKMALRLKVTDLAGRRLSFARATGRFFAEWLTGFTFGIGYVMAAFTSKRQALHDLVAGTVVVTVETEPERIAAAPPAPAMSGWAIAVLVLLVSLFPLGIIAAIAIPAYHDYSVRAEVAEGLQIAAGYKEAVRSHYERSGAWPADLTEVEGRHELVKQVNRSRFVESVEISDGTIVITYGRGANPRIGDYLLSLRPHVMQDGRVAWQCGNAAPPDSVPPHSGVGVTSLEDKNMPAACRTGYGGY
jgi:uncharacterized RDD family membrane protein YckC